jgi:hypothetical protein
MLSARREVKEEAEERDAEHACVEVRLERRQWGEPREQTNRRHER